MLSRALQTALVLVSALSAVPALAATLARVDAVQAPAWITRNEQILPLTPGMELKNSDRISTGEDGRVKLRLAEGSDVKLGANTNFAFYSQSKRPASNFRGALDILSGAFRYTTTSAGKLLKRDISIRVGTSTIGIRGTDVWGRASATEDMAVLIEGKVEIRRGAEVVELSEALTQYRAPKSEEVLPLTRIEPGTLALLAQETEIQGGAGAISAHGRWRVDVGTVHSEREALALYDRCRSAGYPVRIKVRKAAGGHAYTVYLPGVVSGADADVLAGRIRNSVR